MTFASAFAFSMLTALLAIVTTPLLVNWLGDAQFGALRASLDWFGYAGLFEFGVGGALATLFVKALASDDRAQIVNVARAGLHAYRRLSWLMALVTLALTAVLPWILNLPVAWRREVWLGGSVFALGALLTPFLTFRAYLEAAQRGARVNSLLLGQSVLGVGLGLLAARLETGLVGQLFSLTAASAFFPLCLAWLGFRTYPELMNRTTEAISLRELRSLSWPTFGFNVCGRISLLTDNIVIAAFLGPAAVAPFFLTQRVIGLASAQTLGIASATWAGLIDLYLRGDLAAFHHRLLQTIRIATLAGFAILGPVAVWNAFLIECWVGTERYAGDAVTWLASINSIILGTFSVLSWPIVAIGKVRDLLPWAIGVAIVNLGLSLFLTHEFGATGPLWGTLLAYVFVSIPAHFVLMRRHFQLSPWRIFAAVMPPLIVGSLYTIGLNSLRDALPLGDVETSRWLKFAIALGWVGLGTACFLPVAWFLGLRASDRQETRERIVAWLRHD